MFSIFDCSLHFLEGRGAIRKKNRFGVQKQREKKSPLLLMLSLKSPLPIFTLRTTQFIEQNEPQLSSIQVAVK